MYHVLDLETGPRMHLKRKASRWHPDNYIVARGWKNAKDGKCSYEYYSEKTSFSLGIPEECKILVGVNLKFDLLWLWDHPELKAFFKRGGKIWDCQYAEYLIQGQDRKAHYISLNEMAEKYGGTTKIDEVKVLWDEGVMTEDIPKDLLIDYLVGTEEEERNAGDIGNTELVFLAQLKEVKKLEKEYGKCMMKAIHSRMDGLLATTEMEFNGLKIDMVEAKKQLVELTARRVEALKELEAYIPETPDEFEFSWSSPVHKSCLIYGGTVKYRKKDTYLDNKTGELARFRTKEEHYLLEDGTTQLKGEGDPPANVQRFKGGKKKGQPKTKQVAGWGELKRKYQDFFFTFPGYVKPPPGWETKQVDGAKKPLYKTDGDTIEILSNMGVPFCDALVEYFALDKEINTYFLSRDKQGNLTGMFVCIDPDTYIIHHSLNHVSTITSRLSSSDPNLQNVPRADKSKLKRIFVSRFGEDGSMLEADYSQLEVVVQGLLSQDKQLVQDLNDQIDFHCKRVAIQTKYGITYDEVKAIIADENHEDHKKWKVIRTNAKIFSFQRAYGAGATLIAAFTGMSVEEVEQLIAADEATYPGVVEFNRLVENTVLDNAKAFHDPENDFRPFRKGRWQAPTGCLYTFRSWPAKDWQLEKGIEESFNPTEMKNYPIQGTGGEIVQGILGMLYRHFIECDNYGGKAFLVNTVHDCIWVDCHNDVREQVAKDVKRIMESVDVWFEQFGVKVNVPFPVEVELGPNMLDLKHF